jgi:type II secretory pathway pseudopilin PulG
MIEVMISVAILAVVLTVLAGNLSTLSLVRQIAKEEAIAQEIMNGLIERIQGETFSSLGSRNDNISHLNAWSWHRRMTPRFPETSLAKEAIPPMTEQRPAAKVPADALANPEAVLPFSNYLLPVYDKSSPPKLISPGLLSEPSGIPDLEIYLEYYRQDAMLNDLMSSKEPHKTWADIVNSRGPYANSNTLIYSDDIDGDNQMDLSSEPNAAVLIRVVVRWTSRDGGTRTREITFARRQ